MNEPELKTVDGLTQAVGHVMYSADRTDGTKETIKIFALGLRDGRRYVDLLQANDEAGQVELFCKKRAGWSDTLTLESSVYILKRGQELNEDFLASWAERQKALAERLAEKMPSGPSPSKTT
jgi:hypothetical protein